MYLRVSLKTKAIYTWLVPLYLSYPNLFGLLQLFYVLELRKDADNIIQPFVQTITEFKLPCPILSFGVVDASVKTLEKNSELDIEELCNGTFFQQIVHTAYFFFFWKVKKKTFVLAGEFL